VLKAFKEWSCFLQPSVLVVTWACFHSDLCPLLWCALLTTGMHGCLRGSMFARHVVSACFAVDCCVQTAAIDMHAPMHTSYRLDALCMQTYCTACRCGGLLLTLTLYIFFLVRMFAWHGSLGKHPFCTYTSTAAYAATRDLRGSPLAC
jgi:hypothetical protein